jgi:hypothetical protein
MLNIKTPVFEGSRVGKGKGMRSLSRGMAVQSSHLTATHRNKAASRADNDIRVSQIQDMSCLLETALRVHSSKTFGYLPLCRYTCGCSNISRLIKTRSAHRVRQHSVSLLFSGTRVYL